MTAARLLPLLALLALVSTSSSVSAGTVTGELTAVSDDIVRGYSRSEGDPTAQAGLRFRDPSGFFAGLWVSRVSHAFDRRFDDARDLELLAEVGLVHELGQDWAVSATFSYHEYPGTSHPTDASYAEIGVALHHRDLVSLRAAYSDDYLNTGGEALFLEATGAYPLPGGVDLSVGVGRAVTDLPSSDYTYAHAALSRPLGPLDLELGYYWADADHWGPWGEVVRGRWALALTWRFPSTVP
ncbi:MAG: TorF family putative porin [Acidobacteriota bacterium]